MFLAFFFPYSGAGIMAVEAAQTKMAGESCRREKGGVLWARTAVVDEQLFDGLGNAAAAAERLTECVSCMYITAAADGGRKD